MRARFGSTAPNAALQTALLARHPVGLDAVASAELADRLGHVCAHRAVREIGRAHVGPPLTYAHLVIRRPPLTTRPDTIFPYTTLFLSRGLSLTVCILGRGIGERDLHRIAGWAARADECGHVSVRRPRTRRYSQPF